LNTSVGFLADKGNHEVMSIYQLVWRPTFAELSKISTPFNPFRQLTADLAYLH
jgi:hypothetical protein